MADQPSELSERYIQELKTFAGNAGALLEISDDIELPVEHCELFESFIVSITKIVDYHREKPIQESYLRALKDIAGNLLSGLHFDFSSIQSMVRNSERSRVGVKKNILNSTNNIFSQFDDFQFTIGFFSQIKYFDTNIVAIGANGSGKTSLAKVFKRHMGGRGVVVSAQRVLRIPAINAVSNPTNSHKELRNLQNADKSSKGEFSNLLVSEFEKLLISLVSENYLASETYRKLALAAGAEEKIPPPSKTKMDVIIDIWNELITHRTLSCNDGMNFEACKKDNSRYPASHLSDGEKVLLFLIAQALLAPENGFILVDEPEIYLHKAILNRLWDRLEKERRDCKFIYLTHDLDFAASRYDAEKLWIKSYEHPDRWDIEEVPKNSIPEKIILKILGSNKNIIFCEGGVDGLDQKIYECLFKEYTVIPVGSCEDVIGHTKAYNRIPIINNKAVGIIDSDHQPANRISSLQQSDVFSISLAEVENILLDERILEEAIEKMFSEVSVDEIKRRIFNQLERDKEMLVSRFLSQKVDFYFKETNLKMGKTIGEVEENLKAFHESLDLSSWEAEKNLAIEEVISKRDYKGCLSVYNNKGLHSVVGGCLGVKNYQQFATGVLINMECHKALIADYFPQDIFKKLESDC